MAVRLVALLLLGAAALIAVMMMRSPLTIGEDEVRRMITSGELVGLPVEEAAEKLQHAPPRNGMREGVLVFDFGHVKGWRAAGVEVEIEDGRVVAARWEGVGG